MVATGATGAQVVLQQIELDPSSHVEVDHIVQGRLFVAVNFVEQDGSLETGLTGGKPGFLEPTSTTIVSSSSGSMSDSSGSA